MSQAHPQREQLLADFFAGDLDAAGQARLAGEARQDPALARELGALAVTERLLRLACASAGDETFAREVLNRVQARSSGRAFAAQVVRRVRGRASRSDPHSPRYAAREGASRSRRSLPQGNAGWLAAALLLAVAGLFFLARPSHPKGPRTKLEGPAQPLQTATETGRRETSPKVASPPPADRSSNQSAPATPAAPAAPAAPGTGTQQPSERPSADPLPGAPRPQAGTEANPSRIPASEAPRPETAPQEKRESLRAEDPHLAEAGPRQPVEEETGGPEPAPKQAGPRVEVPPVVAEEVGEVLFVAEGKGGGQAVLVRGGAARAPLAKGMKLLAGDRIETGALLPAAGAPGASRPVGAALELRGGAVVDLADATRFEASGYDQALLVEGMLYAQVTREGGQAARKADEGLTFKTPGSELRIGQGRFELEASPTQATVQLEEGRAIFLTPLGRRELGPLQRSTAARGRAPTAPQSIPAAKVWRGRGPAPSGPALLRFDFEDPSGIRNWIAGSWSRERPRAGSKGVLRVDSLEQTEFFSHFKTGTLYHDERQGALFRVTERTRFRFAYFVSAATTEVKIQLSLPPAERKRLALEGAIAWKIENPKTGQWQEASGLVTEVFKHRSGKGLPLQTGVSVEELEFYAGDDNGNAVEFLLDDVVISEDAP